MIDRTLLTSQEVADMFGISPKTLASWRCARRGPCFVKIGRLVRYRLADIEQGIDAGIIGEEYTYRRAEGDDEIADRDDDTEDEN